MPADLIQFVDSISATPTVRLDLNDEVNFWVKRFDAPPPRMRRSMASNAMRDGVHVGSSSYGERVLTIEMESIHSSQDLAAVQMQKLWRELDRPDNWIRYQPNGATKPVFFRTYRSDASQLEDVMAQAAMRTFTVEVLAEPFALGLRETIGPVTVNNDPAAASNGLFLDATGVIGDVSAPVVAVFNPGLERFGYLASTVPVSSSPRWAQVEAGTAGTDTTNPGGGPDAAMSGATLNNFLRTSFATTATMTTRATVNLTLDGSQFKLFGVLRRSDATSAMTARAMVNGVTGPTVTVPQNTVRQLVELGAFSPRAGAPMASGYGGSATDSTATFALQAARASGTGTLDWDYIIALPADDAMLNWDIVNDDSVNSVVIDSYAETIFETGAPANLFAATNSGLYNRPAAGGFPRLRPNVTNRLYVVTTHPGTGHVKADANTVTLHYWPQFLHVRPVAS